MSAHSHSSSAYRASRAHGLEAHFSSIPPRSAMHTFAFIVATWTAVSGQPGTANQAVVDHDLSYEDCQVLLEAYKPTKHELGSGLTVSHTALCRPE
ncbi:hypothetical protein [Agrobacterium sp. CG674]